MKLEDGIRATISFSKKTASHLPVFIKKKKWRKSVTIYRRKKRPKKIISVASKFKYLLLGTLLSFMLFFLPSLIILFLQDLPNPNELMLNQIPQTTKIFDRHGILLAQIYASQNRTVIPLSSIPDRLQQATLTIEDKNFYKHPGFDLLSILRATIANLSGNQTQGGSTITQQLIKSSMLTPEKSLLRKIKEIVLAFWAERLYTKKQILEMYFNQVPYGGTAWGIEAATQTYFGKNTKDLNLSECAFLAGLTSAPTLYSPFGSNPNLWKHRQKEVLDRMVSLGYISQKQEAQAEKVKLEFRKQQTAIYAPHFVEYVKQLVSQKYGLPMLERGGLAITTTLDLKTEELAEKIVKDEIENNSYLNLTNGASIITSPRSGDIIAMVGSHDWNDPNGGNFNITTSRRQPGSSIKVVTYAAALQNGFTAASIIDDAPVTYINAGVPYSPVNYDGKFHGKATLRQALANSLNVPAVKTLNKIGIPTMVNLAKKMGITTWGDPENYGLSVTLGAAEVNMLDMATVYATLANEGSRVDLNPILKITDSKGAILEKKTEPEGTQVLAKGVAFILSDILSDNQARAMEFGTNSPLNIQGHTVAVKTGTSDNKRDNWTIGFTKNFVVAVWVGNNNNTPMSPTLASGITGAAPIWHNIMQNLLNTTPETKLTPPPEVIQKFCSVRTEYFLKGTENTPDCIYTKISSIENPQPPPKNHKKNF